jgi:isochorismate hydrolase
MPSTQVHPPTNYVNWALHPKRAVLLVHDMQRYFLKPFSERAQDELRQQTGLMVAACEAATVPVAYSGQTGRMTARERGLMTDFWGNGMSRSGGDSDWLPGVHPRPHDWVLEKTRYSAFFGTQLLSHIRDAARDQLLICGVYTHVGILATALDAFSNDIEVFLVSDATADMSPERHQVALDQAALTCARVMTTTDVLDVLRQHD